VLLHAPAAEFASVVELAVLPREPAAVALPPSDGPAAFVAASWGSCHAAEPTVLEGCSCLVSVAAG